MEQDDNDTNEEAGMFGRPEEARTALRGWLIVIASTAGIFLATAAFLAD